MIDQKRRIYPYIALTATVLFWGFSFILTKIALTGFRPFTLIFLRFLIASLLFLLIFLRNGFPKFSFSVHFSIFIIALFQPWLYFIFETYGLQYTSASKTSLIIATIPICVLFLSIFILKEIPRLFHLLGIIASIVGVVFLVLGDPAFKWRMDSVVLGDSLILGAVITGAFYTVLVRRLGMEHSVTGLTGMQIFWGTLLFTPEFIWEFGMTNWAEIRPGPVLSVLGLAVFATIGAFLCFNYALSQIEAVKASIFVNGIPLVTAVGAWFILDETLTSSQMIGGLIILSGVYLANSKSFKKRKLRYEYSQES